jgi:hypothetical protein
VRRTRHRRRFHTDRIVANRRARYLRETPELARWSGNRLSYGALADRDPWDCGNPRCGICHWPDYGRAREAREWRAYEDAAWR